MLKLARKFVEEQFLYVKLIDFTLIFISIFVYVFLLIIFNDNDPRYPYHSNIWFHLNLVLNKEI
jgi:hypothetical protein